MYFWLKLTYTSTSFFSTLRHYLDDIPEIYETSTTTFTDELNLQEMTEELMFDFNISCVPIN